MEDCIEIKQSGNVIEASCVLGLWSVSGTDRDKVLSQARHCFELFRQDGEYYKIIGGDSPLDTMFVEMNKICKQDGKVL